MFNGHTASSVIFTTRKRSLGQGDIFATVCHSVHRVGWVCLSACWDTTTPSPGTRHTPLRNQAHIPEQTPPWSRHPPPPTPDQTCPQSRHPLPGAVHAGRYGQQAGGMHPTGMQSCMLCKFLFVFYSTNGIPNKLQKFCTSFKWLGHNATSSGPKVCKLRLHGSLVLAPTESTTDSLLLVGKL